MKKLTYILFAALLTSLLPACKPNKPTVNRTLPKEYTLGYEQIYGHCYDSLPNVAVVALDLYSEGLELDKNRHIKGTGYNLYLSDIFVPDSLLVPGSYRSDTSALPFTCLPGMAFEGYPHGMYILNIEDDKVVHIQLVDSGSFVYRNDSILFTLYYRNTYNSKATYYCHFAGTLIPWLKQ